VGYGGRYLRLRRLPPSSGLFRRHRHLRLLVPVRESEECRAEGAEELAMMTVGGSRNANFHSQFRHERLRLQVYETVRATGRTATTAKWLAFLSGVLEFYNVYSDVICAAI
jgi:hypothetical protein